MNTNWHFEIREQARFVLIGIIEKLERKYNCKSDIEKILREREERKKNRWFLESED